MTIKRRIDEKHLLEMLGIPSFRHMTKDKIATFVSSLPDIDPEVAKKALEQFPNLSSVMAEIVSHYRGIISECLAGSDADTRLCLKTCASLIESIQRELENEQLTFEQKEALIDDAMKLVQTMREIDADGKRFRLRTIGEVAAVVCTVAGIIVAALGVKTGLASRFRV